METIKLAMLGYGNAGRAFKGLLEEKAEELAQRYDKSFEFVSIVTKSKGDLLGSPNETGLDVAQAADYDVLIELTPLVIQTGQPAISHIEAALLRGKDVITGNKGPVAHAYKRLSAMARENGCLFLCETTVMDGTPVFNLKEETLKMCQVTEVEGILNSTTNFILEEMERGVPMDEILAKGKELGFVEADPSMDIDGYDSAGKVTALINVLMDADMTPDEIQREGIGGVTYEDVREAKARGEKIKLLCRGWREHDRIHGKVWPARVSACSLYGTLGGTSSVLSLTTDLMGKLTIIEEDPEILQTAYGVFSDLLRILEKEGTLDMEEG